MNSLLLILKSVVLLIAAIYHGLAKDTVNDAEDS
jgi:hypothetical protein